MGNGLSGKSRMNITVYCGASLGSDSAYQAAAKKLGKWIADSDDLLPSAFQTAKLFTLFLLETYAHMKDPEQSSMTARRFSCVSI